MQRPPSKISMSNFMCSVRQLKDLLGPWKILLKLDSNIIEMIILLTMIVWLHISIYRGACNLLVSKNKWTNSNSGRDVGLNQSVWLINYKLNIIEYKVEETILIWIVELKGIWWKSDLYKHLLNVPVKNMMTYISEKI